MKCLFVKNKKKLIISFSLIFFLMILLFFFYQDEKEKKPLEQKETSPRVEDISSFKGKESKIISFGRIEAEEEAVIFSETSGILKRVLPLIGERVSSGQILAEFDNKESQIRLDQSKALLMAQEARLNELYAGNLDELINIRRSAVAVAKSSLNRIKEQTEEAVLSAKKAYLNNDIRAYLNNPEKFIVESSLTPPTITGIYNGEKEGDYIVSIYKSKSQTGYSFRYKDPLGREGFGIVSSNTPQVFGEDGLYIQFPENFEDDFGMEWIIPIPNNRSTTYLTFKNAYQNVINEKDPSIMQAKENLRQREEELSLALSGTREEQIMAQRAQVMQARSSYEMSLTSLEKQVVRAPFEGIISSISSKENDFLMTGQEIIRIFGGNSYKIKVGISPEKANAISLGDRAVIDDKYQGEVFAVLNSINPKTGQSEAWIRINEEEKSPIVGKYAKVEIFSKQDRESVFIPLSSLGVNGKEKFIFTYENGEIKRIPVVTGEIEGDRILIIRGVEEISNIILNPSYLNF